MSLARPKRKAAINKSYNDTLDESYFEEQPSSPTSVSSSSSTGKRKYTKRGTFTPNDVKVNTTVTNKHALPYNWQPPPLPIDYFSNKLNLTDAYIDLKHVCLYCPQQTPIPMSYDIIRRRKSKEIFKLQKGDYIYMVSEPSGEPYYIGRIMGFTLKNNSKTGLNESADDNRENIVDAKDYVFQIQWFYRPRDISKSTSDSRLLYASMHSDTCPLSSFRGIVTVRHKQDIEDEFEENNNTNSKKSSSPHALSCLEAYTQQPNSFYFDKLFDRYMIKFYDILLTASLLKLANLENSTSQNFLIALNKRFEFIFVESQRAKSMIEGFSSNSRNCEKCGQWCSNQDSVSCAVCEKYYHMLCLDPPLYKKPSRGFSWSCASCTKKHEIEYRSKKMLMLSHDNKSSNASEISHEIKQLNSSQEISPEPEEEDKEDDEKESTPSSLLPKYELMAIDFLEKDKHLTLEERRLKEEWSMRYLGMYTRLEDGVDLEDRSPYPRASTRLGAKHQATNIPEVYDHNIVYYDIDNQKTSNGKKRAVPKKSANGKSKVKDEQDIVKLEVPDEFKDIPPNEYPQWLQPRPKGYIERGVDDGEGITSTLLWKHNEDDDEPLDLYIQRCTTIAEKLNLSPNSPNFVDEILKIYMKNDRNGDKAFAEASKLTRKTLREPTFTKEEVNRFEAGVKKYGSELFPVYKEVKTQPCSMVVRFYYIWKKTKNGRLIWGNYEGRRQKKPLNLTTEEEGFSTTQEVKEKAHDDLNDSEDDSSYENDKIIACDKHFTCKHCNTNQSIKWFKITGSESHNEEDDNDNNIETMNGLCFRCARIWRRYAVVWEDPTEVEKKNNKPASGWKKKIEFELLRDANFILDESEAKGGGLSYDKRSFGAIGVEIPKSKVNSSKSSVSAVSTPSVVEQPPSKKAINKEEPPSKKKKTNPPSGSETNIKKEAPQAKAKDDTKKPETKVKVPGKPGRKPGKAKATVAPDTDLSDSKAKVKKTKSTDKTTKKAAAKEKDNKATKAGKAKTTENNTSNSDDTIKVKKEERKKELSSTPQPGQTTVKRHKKNSMALAKKIINPMFNSNYLMPHIGPTTKIDKKTIPVITKEILADIVTNFRKRQLTDLTQQLHSLQIPHLTSISLPFNPSDRKCCICREHDTSEATSNMLICSHCGVNVHESCAGISIPPQVARPIKEWLCEVCVNDLKPYHSTLYSCSLCLANESNYELSILGSPSVRPDFLKPVFESGKWCHLLCAIFNYDLVDFKYIPQPTVRRLIKEEVTDQKTIIESTQNLISIESISKIYLKNYTSQCGICKSYNGSLMVCHMCEMMGKENEKFHITCAQDTPNFKLGFKLELQSLNVKDNKLTKIGNACGKLKPILVCPEHDQSYPTVYDMRALGCRTHGTNKDDLKPLIQFFLEDIARANNGTKLTGGQFKASKYIEYCKIFEEEEAKVKLQNQFLKLFNSVNKMSLSNVNETKTCGRCKTKASPMWWIKNISQTTNEPDKYLCQLCYHICDRKIDQEDADTEIEDMTKSLVDLLETPLRGENYGIIDDNDKIPESFDTTINSDKVDISKEVRSHISIGDILS